MFAAALCVAVTLAPAPASAWGVGAHRYIMGRAIDLLPPELRPFFERHRDEVVLRVTDPDLWRTVGWPEGPHHFVNFGVREYGPYPFTALPRDYGTALERFGAETLQRNGLLPWREAEMFGQLRRAFEAFAREAPYGASDTILFAAVASHYVQDAYQPLHATGNFDGQQTGQRGVHARFERDLFERFSSRLSVKPLSPVPMANARDAAFDALLASHRLVDAVLEADKQASAGRTAYDAAYFERFFTSVRAIFEQRLSEAVTGTAGMIIGAWEQAGKPALRIQDVRPVVPAAR